MLFVKNVKYCEAETAEHIEDFAREIVIYRSSTICDVIGKFNGIYIEVKYDTTEKDIIDYYRRRI